MIFIAASLENIRAQALANVFVGAEDSIVGSHTVGGLEEGVDHTLSPGDILLVI